MKLLLHAYLPEAGAIFKNEDGSFSLSSAKDPSNLQPIDFVMVASFISKWCYRTVDREIKLEPKTWPDFVKDGLKPETVEDWMKSVLNVAPDTVEYLGKDLLPNDLAISNARSFLKMLHFLGQKPTAVRCSTGGVGIAFIRNFWGDQKRYAHIECDNDGSVAFLQEIPMNRSQAGDVDDCS